MGFAKYAEDNIDIMNSRMYDRKTSFPERNIVEFKKEVRYRENTIEKEEEYRLLLREIKKVVSWIAIINSFYRFAGSNIFLNLLNEQKISLQGNRDEFTDYKYDPKFKEFRHKTYNIEEEYLRKFKKSLGDRYLDYFVEKLGSLGNKNENDAIELNSLIWDLKEFLINYLSININDLDKPVIQFVREDILKEEIKPMIICSHCKRKTYSDFKTCIFCKYPNEVR